MPSDAAVHALKTCSQTLLVRLKALLGHISTHSARAGLREARDCACRSPQKGAAAAPRSEEELRMASRRRCSPPRNRMAWRQPRGTLARSRGHRHGIHPPSEAGTSQTRVSPRVISTSRRVCAADFAFDGQFASQLLQSRARHSCGRHARSSAPRSQHPIAPALLRLLAWPRRGARQNVGTWPRPVP